MTARSGLSDTDPVIAAMVIAAHRAMSPEQKMQRVIDCNAAAEAMALAGLRARHRGASERELRWRLAALRYGREMAIAAFKWDPEQACHGQ